MKHLSTNNYVASYQIKHEQTTYIEREGRVNIQFFGTEIHV